MKYAAMALMAGMTAIGLTGPATAAQQELNGVKYNFSSQPWKLDDKFLPKTVSYTSDERPGTIIVYTRKKHLYLILGNDKAKRYGIGVGRWGFKWSGTEKITRKAKWPDWIPPPEMRQREPDLPARMKGGPDNPLGARALYLGNTLYRIHGTSQPWTIGTAVSSGCIRLRNEDVEDLYTRVKIGSKVIVK
ncbi:MAG: L,D-transpeptidase [Rhizobiales bacterium]|nr:L,D-transpeptidase [Hyphomicrobiales bacterium]